MYGIVVRCLQIYPADRYPNVADMAADLRRAGEQGESTGQIPASTQTRYAPVSSAPETRTGSSSASFAQPPTAGREKISIGVLPFRSLSADEEDSYMAMGIGSEIKQRPVARAGRKSRFSPGYLSLSRE
jgi:hypothetical protein